MTWTLNFPPVQVLPVLRRWWLRLSSISLSPELGHQFRCRLDTVGRFVTGITHAVAVPVGEVRRGNVWAIVRLVGNCVTIRVLIDRAGVAIAVAVRIGLIRILNIGAIVERVRDVVAIRVEVEKSWLV